MSRGPSMHLPDASVLAVPSGASVAFKESSGQADTVGSAVGRGGIAFFSQRQSPLCPPSSISRAGQGARSQRGSSPLLAVLQRLVCPLSPPVTLVFRASGSSARGHWELVPRGISGKNSGQSHSGTAELEEAGEGEFGFQTSQVSDLSSELFEASLASPNAITCITLPCEAPCALATAPSPSCHPLW